MLITIGSDTARVEFLFSSTRALVLLNGDFQWADKSGTWSVGSGPSVGLETEVYDNFAMPKTVMRGLSRPGRSPTRMGA